LIGIAGRLPVVQTKATDSINTVFTDIVAAVASRVAGCTDRQAIYASVASLILVARAVTTLCVRLTSFFDILAGRADAVPAVVRAVCISTAI
jgi:hypothetical protein